jgi:wyosine [tRNA(Phe)-imidazoG37] synthetase (radical SAM superfamily)
MNSFRYLYGPVPSRRLGRSLGIDLVPHKICTYDCIYCQIGETTKKTLLRKEYNPVEEILGEVKRFLPLEGDSPIDHFSLSGSGEPTLHSQIGSVIKGIKSISSVPVAVITNGSLLYKKEVREALLEADIVLPSLDAVSPEIFKKINQPHHEITVEKVIEGMIEFRKVYRGEIWLEILLCKGINDCQNELQRLQEAIGRIQPDRIHLNTVVRPPSEQWAIPLTQGELEAIRQFLGEKASIISEFDRHLEPVPGKDFQQVILKTLKRRPLSLADLTVRMGIPSDEITHSIDQLMREGKIRSLIFGDSTYYEIS